MHRQRTIPINVQVLLKPQYGIDAPRQLIYFDRRSLTTNARLKEDDTPF